VTIPSMSGSHCLAAGTGHVVPQSLISLVRQDTDDVKLLSAPKGQQYVREEHMKNTALKVLLTAAVLIPLALYAQPRAGNPTTATVISKAEIDKISATEQSQQTRDENARVVDIGDGWSMELGIIHRSKQRVMTVGEAQAARGRGNAPAAAGRGNAQAAAPTTPCGEQMANPPADALQGAITHDNQTEGYYIVSGGGTAFIDGKVVNGRRSTNNPDGGPNGPGCGGGVAVGSRKVELKVGDVLIVPPGVIHGWFDIPDHVDYLSFRPSHGVMKNGWVNPTIASK
jgi:mannose-6-phosphate isomerase-like protein (cupin superfamily)